MTPRKTNVQVSWTNVWNGAIALALVVWTGWIQHKNMVMQNEQAIKVEQVKVDLLNANAKVLEATHANAESDKKLHAAVEEVHKATNGMSKKLEEAAFAAGAKSEKEHPGQEGKKPGVTDSTMTSNKEPNGKGTQTVLSGLRRDDWSQTWPVRRMPTGRGVSRNAPTDAHEAQVFDDCDGHGDHRVHQLGTGSIVERRRHRQDGAVEHCVGRVDLV
jgi:hypothetical protein